MRLTFEVFAQSIRSALSLRILSIEIPNDKVSKSKIMKSLQNN
jgi:hypothetical protein